MKIWNESEKVEKRFRRVAATGMDLECRNWRELNHLIFGPATAVASMQDEETA
ncbi:unnamed protein product [Dovyalis caffra]|uniref:Uncharacterized protein n=1 Tax=Dovyalis caffra TaxID=77055 RepID=A0AAV1S5B9_9ROSI|nr:unnamed protein product [Dovyalis caffra]